MASTCDSRVSGIIELARSFSRDWCGDWLLPGCSFGPALEALLLSEVSGTTSISSGTASCSLLAYAAVPGTSPWRALLSTFSRRVRGTGDAALDCRRDCASAWPSLASEKWSSSLPESAITGLVARAIEECGQIADTIVFSSGILHFDALAGRRQVRIRLGLALRHGGQAQIWRINQAGVIEQNKYLIAASV